MKRVVLVALALVAAGFRLAAPAELPQKMTYLFFVQGKMAGRSDITTTLQNGIYVMSSSQEVAFGDMIQKLECRTEVDARTLRARSFHYKGVRQEDMVSGTVQVQGDSARGTLEAKGVPYTGKAAWSDPTFFFENYVPEHLVVIGRHIAASTKAQARFSVVFPSDMIRLPGAGGLESEVEVPARPAPIVCNKYAVAFQNATPFYLLMDPQRNIPVYMIFPATQTEIFLKEAFGDSPKPNYVGSTAP